MNHALVVYFSRSGYTRTLAREIAARCGADVEVIEEIRSRAGFWGYLRSGREAMRRQAVDIKSGVRSPANYEIVVFGTPVWASHVSSPMRAYLMAHARHCRRVAFFCTQGGSGAEKVFREMADLCGREPVATAVFNDHAIEQGKYADEIARFVNGIALPRAA